MVSRRSGVMVPLFSLVSSKSWGVGEFVDLQFVARWLQQAAQSFIQILPITEIPVAETSPYSALTAMALDPIYISLPAVEDFAALGGEKRLNEEDRSALESVRRSPRVDHRLVRRLKSRYLRASHAHFIADDAASHDTRWQQFADFVKEQESWLEEYALFQALRQEHGLQPWWEWPPPLSQRDPGALEAARERLQSEISYRRYVQWIADQQWAAARADSHPLKVLGDVPFMISADSPDVWTRQREFRFDATVGAPPDAFSETGQDWGLPPWRWEVMAADDFEWMKKRARRTAALFDGFRLDHLVGLYRTYVRPLDKTTKAFFAPAEEPLQRLLGERLVTIYKNTGAEIIAEDLGAVPDFVRESLLKLGVPGFKVMRWERQWNVVGHPFVDPPTYPMTSVATSGTHDIEPLADWWQSAPEEERRQMLAVPAVARYLNHSTPPFDALLRGLLDAGSGIVIIPLQDVFGWTDRINTPAVIGDENWTWRVPWDVDRLDEIKEAQERAKALAEWTRASGR
jgi:4-alpha-glucanotransferase